ncbi:MAG: NAD(P)H-hydrate dehydratase [Zoogloeaceae bacterium]|nr:NAD(P)H-hydrate dehydratase [Zoogloeaceae bacterium]
MKKSLPPAFSPEKSQLSLYCRDSLRHLESLYADAALMRRAGAAAAAWAEDLLGAPHVPAATTVLVLAGPGNNGGDALTMATLLRRRQVSVITILHGEVEHLPKDAAQAYRQFVDEGGAFVPEIPPEARCDLIVDGLFGIGLTRALTDDAAQLVEAANRLAREWNCPLLALDCPSGLNTDTGFCQGAVIRATHTLAFIAAKPGFYTANGADCCGQIRVDSLGIAPDALRSPDGQRITPDMFAHCLRPRKYNSHKGIYGNVGVIGGTHSMSGAALLAGRAALKLGAGCVFLGLLDTQAPSVDFLHPEIMIRKPESVFDAILSALACGPGMGRSDHAAELLELAINYPAPLVLDADALNLLAFDDNLQNALLGRKIATLLTPHPAEAARLLDLQTADIQQNRIRMAQELARRYHAWIVLKGSGSVISAPDGAWWLNTTGNPGLSGPGFGDVLSGMLLALLGQGWPPDAALQAAAHLHGQAADDLVDTGTGPVGLCAGELIDAARARFNDWLRERQ